ncbi:MAG: hypothetical protein AB7P40_07395 [Chloroflexota bacterium]
MRQISLRNWLRPLLVAALLATGIGLTPSMGIPAASANDEMLPDLNVTISSTSGNDKPHVAGQDVSFLFSVTNAGWTATYPYVTMLIPEGFTNVRVLAAADGITCAIKPPTSAIPGHLIDCTSVTGIVNGEFPGILAHQHRKGIIIGATAPARAGKYHVTAGVGDMEKKEIRREDNNASVYISVISAGAAAVEHPRAGNPVPGPTPPPVVKGKPREGICVTKKC